MLSETLTTLGFVRFTTLEGIIFAVTALTDHTIGATVFGVTTDRTVDTRAAAFAPAVTSVPMATTTDVATERQRCRSSAHSSTGYKQWPPDDTHDQTTNPTGGRK